MLIRLPLALLASVISLALPLQAETQFSCEDLFLKLESGQDHRAFRRPRFLVERSSTTFTHLAREDDRFAVLKLAKASPVVDRLDHFTSPALMRAAILKEPSAATVGAYLRSVTENGSAISAAIAQSHRLPSHVQVLFDTVESRYRVATELLGLAYFERTNQRPQLDPAQYAYELLRSVRDAVLEIFQHTEFQGFFDGIDLNSIHWQRVAAHIAEQLNVRPLFSFSSSVPESVFQDDFLRSLNPNLSLPEILTETSRFLEERLEALTVGISYRPKDFISAVRFNDLHFFGYYYGFKAMDRAAYLKASESRGGVMEVDFRMDRRKKKILAVLLDRSHRNLDPVFFLKNKTDQCLHTCGSYVPTMFLRSGVPIVSPAYFTPLPAILSLALQHRMGFKHVESVRFVNLDPNAIPRGKGEYLYHEIAGFGVELVVYAGLGWIGSAALLSLF